MGSSNDEYLIVKGIADDKELENYRLCFEKNDSPRDLKNLQWLHQKNPANTHTIYYAMYGPHVAAIYTAIPVIFLIDGVQKTALQSIDTMTDLDHRGKGLFPKLAAKLYSDAEANDFELVYGFPNENSAPGFFKKLKWISFGEAPFLLKPLSVWYFINKFLKKSKAQNSGSEYYSYSIPPKKIVGKNIAIKSLESFDDSYDAIWQQAAANTKVAVNRSAAYMNWRYVIKPGEEYSKCGIFINDRLCGIIVFTIKTKHGGRIGYIMELIYNDDLPGAGVTLLKYASSIFKKEKADAALAWCFPHSFNYAAFKKAGYFNLPVKFRPQHLFLGVRAFNKGEKELIENMSNWYISYSDSDTV